MLKGTVIQIDNILVSYPFPSKFWVTNYVSYLSHISEKTSQKTYTLFKKSTTLIKRLSILMWNQNFDCICCQNTSRISDTKDDIQMDLTSWNGQHLENSCYSNNSETKIKFSIELLLNLAGNLFSCVEVLNNNKMTSTTAHICAWKERLGCIFILWLINSLHTVMWTSGL